MSASSHWYTSGTTLGYGGILATLLGSAAAIWGTYLLSHPRRQLFFRLDSITALLSASPDVREKLRVFYEKKKLKDPHILNVKLRNAGREDIASDVFDRERPIVLDVGLPIVTLLPANGEVGVLPRFEFENTAIKVGPDLIRSRQRMNFVLLVEGSDARLTCKSYVVNFKVNEEPSEQEVKRRLGLVFGPIEIVALAVAIVIFTVSSNSSGGNNEALGIWLAVCGFILFFALGLQRLALRWSQR